MYPQGAEIIPSFQNRPKTHNFLIDSGYHTQLDNWTKYHGSGSRQCRLTAYVNALDYVLNGEISRESAARGYQEPEDLYGEVLAKFGDTTQTVPNTRAALEFGVRGYFSDTASLDDVAHANYLGVPVPIGVAYKTSGHWKTVVGRNSGGFYIDDPYGTRLGYSNNYLIGVGGDNDHVSWNWLRRCFIDMGDQKGYAFFITHVKGKPTGVRNGM
jgi:hypothetical protein